MSAIQQVKELEGSIGVHPDLLKKLRAEMPYKWRVQGMTKAKDKYQCVAYIDARQAMEHLDQVLGPENWSKKYSEHKGHIYCHVGINIMGNWVWKEDCGSESNVEAEKGEASDAFKRACVNWGIGRFLYDLKIQYVPTTVKQWDVDKYIKSNGNVKTNIVPLEKPKAEEDTIPYEPDPPQEKERSPEELQAIQKIKDTFPDAKEIPQATPEELEYYVEQIINAGDDTIAEVRASFRDFKENHHISDEDMEVIITAGKARNLICSLPKLNKKQYEQMKEFCQALAVSVDQAKAELSRSDEYVKLGIVETASKLINNYQQ